MTTIVSLFEVANQWARLHIKHPDKDQTLTLVIHKSCMKFRIMKPQVLISNQLFNLTFLNFKLYVNSLSNVLR